MLRADGQPEGSGDHDRRRGVGQRGGSKFRHVHRLDDERLGRRHLRRRPDGLGGSGGVEEGAHHERIAQVVGRVERRFERGPNLLGLLEITRPSRSHKAGGVLLHGGLGAEAREERAGERGLGRLGRGAQRQPAQPRIRRQRRCWDGAHNGHGLMPTPVARAGLHSGEVVARVHGGAAECVVQLIEQAHRLRPAPRLAADVKHVVERERVRCCERPESTRAHPAPERIGGGVVAAQAQQVEHLVARVRVRRLAHSLEQRHRLLVPLVLSECQQCRTVRGRRNRFRSRLEHRQQLECGPPAPTLSACGQRRQRAAVHGRGRRRLGRRRVGHSGDHAHSVWPYARK